jgi:hypothetical protein
LSLKINLKCKILFFTIELYCCDLVHTWANGTSHTSSDDEMHKVGCKIIRLGFILAHRTVTIINKGKTYICQGNNNQQGKNLYLSSIISSTKIVENFKMKRLIIHSKTNQSLYLYQICLNYAGKNGNTKKNLLIINKTKKIENKIRNNVY